MKIINAWMANKDNVVKEARSYATMMHRIHQASNTTPCCYVKYAHGADVFNFDGLEITMFNRKLDTIKIAGNEYYARDIYTEDERAALSEGFNVIFDSMQEMAAVRERLANR